MRTEFRLEGTFLRPNARQQNRIVVSSGVIPLVSHRDGVRLSFTASPRTWDEGQKLYRLWHGISAARSLKLEELRVYDDGFSRTVRKQERHTK